MYWAVLGGVNSYLSVYSAIFGMVTNEQPGEPRASLLLTSVRRQSFAITLDFLHRLAQSTICKKGGSKNPTNLDLLSLGSNVVVEQGGAGSDLASRHVASRWKTSN